MLKSFPLCWPDGWKRMPSYGRKEGRFYTRNQAPSVSDGVGRVMAELTKLAVSRDDMIISTNVPTRLDGLPRGDQRNPEDPGAAVYWRKGPNAPMKCMAVDRYRAVADNLCAIAATLEAMRAIERHGGAEILERTFRGFAALPEKAGRSWREILLKDAQNPNPTKQDVEEGYHTLARTLHPDVPGGSHEAMSELNRARVEALAEVG